MTCEFHAMTKAEKLLQAGVERLDKFKTANGIARFLARNGIKGIRNSPDSCPIAVYLQQPIVSSLEGSNNTVEVQVGLNSARLIINSSLVTRLDVSRTCQTFIGNFDEDEYEFLERRPRYNRVKR